MLKGTALDYAFCGLGGKPGAHVTNFRKFAAPGERDQKGAYSTKSVNAAFVIPII